jgi:AraC family transcriptional regulator, transcriptional activator of pobA
MAIPFHHFAHNFDGFEIGRIEELQPLARASFPHRHSFYEIFWIKAGSGTHSIDFEGYPIQPDTLFFISPGQVHYWLIEAPMRGYALLFTPDLLHRIKCPPYLHIDTVGTPVFDNLCNSLLEEYQTQGYEYMIVIKAMMEILLVQARRRVNDDGHQEHSLTEQFIALVDLHFREKQNVKAYAQLLGVTPGHLTDTTREAKGIPAGAFIRQRITLEAKRMLAHSEQTVSEIGYGLGFEDISYFTRFFKRESGFTPKEFREDLRKKYQTFLK